MRIGSTVVVRETAPQELQDAYGGLEMTVFTVVEEIAGISCAPVVGVRCNTKEDVSGDFEHFFMEDLKVVGSDVSSDVSGGIYKVVWGNGTNDCGEFPYEFSSWKEADDYGSEWADESNAREGIDIDSADEGFASYTHQVVRDN